MTKLNHIFIVAAFVFSFLLSCTGTPSTLADIDPLFYEDENVRIDFAIGTRVFYFSVYNKTGKLIQAGDKAYIVSIGNQARRLLPVTESAYIPPNSWVLFNPDRETFFNINMYALLAKKSNKEIVRTYFDEDLIESMQDRIIRIYISFIINDEEFIYDIPIKINGVMPREAVNELVKNRKQPIYPSGAN
jgi:hypothetical protein